jgi:hypothetical protein
VGEQVEALEDHPNALAQPCEVAADHLLAGEHGLAADLHLRAVGPLEQVHAAQQRGLAAAALPDDADDLRARDVQRDVVQHEPLAVV